jgi:FMN phosphatase YigB (HAD superfamily)
MILVDFNDGGECERSFSTSGGRWTRASGLSLSRDDFDSAYAYATRRAYNDSELLREYGLARLVDYLVRAQFEWLLENGPFELRRMLDRSGVRKSQIAEQISRGFVGESVRGLERGREVLRALKSHFSIGVVSNFYGNLDRVLAEAGIAGLLVAVADSTRLGFFKPDVRIFEEALHKRRCTW